jgi:hypothetical protein
VSDILFFAVKHGGVFDTYIGQSSTKIIWKHHGFLISLELLGFGDNALVTLTGTRYKSGGNGLSRDSHYQYQSLIRK